MKKNLLFVVLCLWSAIPLLCFAQSVNTTTTLNWVFDSGTEGQLASYTDGTTDYFNQDYVALGTNLAYKGARTSNGVSFTLFQPTEQTAIDATNLVGFAIRPKSGLTFTPTSISFDSQRYGTGSGLITVKWKSPDGTETVIAEEFKPARDNEDAVTSTSIDASALSIPTSAGECVLEVFVYDLGNTKQIGLANIVIQGTIAGTIVDVPMYTINTAVYPENAGSIVSSPVGTEMEENTEITLTAERNFGYEFSHWEDANEQTVSTENPYTFSLTANTTLKAVYNTINTYSLTTTVEGANDYMVAISPEGTMVNNERMFEEGTAVTLSAWNNSIATFTNWTSGETTAEKVVTMTENKTVTAVYSTAEYIAGWDFYNTGNSGRVADFASNVDNESAALVLRDADGNTSGWLDKSEMAAGGYEGQSAAVKWTNIDEVDNYYQITVNAKDFTDITVESQLLLNYNSYSVNNVQYSTDGNNFTTIGTFTLTTEKVWEKQILALPEAANHAETLFIRWLPDYTSTLVGTESTKDGLAISGIYVTGKEEVYNDGVAPVLVSTIPANGADNASASGKVVLTFDEKVQVADNTTVTFNGVELTPQVLGKTVTFDYSGLDYSTSYAFSLAGNTVSDLAGNTLTDAIAIEFSTMTKPTVTKKTFDFIVGVDGDFKAALEAASAAASTGNRFYIFFPDGEYNIGENTGDGNQMTTITTPNISYVGQSNDKVILYNECINESINSTATINFTSAVTNVYMQDISLQNRFDYVNIGGRAVALCDQGDRNIYKNVKLLSYQDTYYTKVNRSYLENCEIHGVVDFICGGGDIFFNACTIFLEDRSGNCITAPSTSGDWGYVFSDCTIDGYASNDGSYRLGRPWSNAPKTVFINSTMKVLPTAAGWGDPMNVVPSVFAEYNSMTASGGLVDLTYRRTNYAKDAKSVTLNPVLSAEQAATYTVENVLGGTDNWEPKMYTEQAAAPAITGSGNSIQWDNSDYVLCWAIFENDQFVEFTTSNSYLVPNTAIEGTVYTVRAANEMGGLSEVSNAYVYTADGSNGIDDVDASLQLEKQYYYNIQGVMLPNIDHYKGIVIIKSVYSNGLVKTEKVMVNNY